MCGLVGLRRGDIIEKYIVQGVCVAASHRCWVPHVWGGVRCHSGAGRYWSDLSLRGTGQTCTCLVTRHAQQVSVSQHPLLTAASPSPR